MTVSSVSLSDRRRTFALVAPLVWADSRLAETEVEALDAVARVLGVDSRIAGPSRPEPLELPETTEARRLAYAVATWLAGASPALGAAETTALARLATRLGIGEHEADRIVAETRRASAVTTRGALEREVDLRRVLGWVLSRWEVERAGP